MGSTPESERRDENKRSRCVVLSIDRHASWRVILTGGCPELRVDNTQSMGVQEDHRQLRGPDRAA